MENIETQMQYYRNNPIENQWFQGYIIFAGENILSLDLLAKTIKII